MTKSRLPKEFKTKELEQLIEFNSSEEVEPNDALANLIDALDYLHLEDFKPSDRKEVIKLVLESILILDEVQNQTTKVKFKDIKETKEGEEVTIERGEMILEHLEKEIEDKSESE